MDSVVFKDAKRNGFSFFATLHPRLDVPLIQRESRKVEKDDRVTSAISTHVRATDRDHRTCQNQEILRQAGIGRDELRDLK